MDQLSQKSTSMINTNNNSNMQHNQNKFSLFEEDNEDDLVEIRPIRRRDAVEKGLDYWIDDSDWLKEKQRRSAFKNRKVCKNNVLFVLYLDVWIVLFSSNALVHSLLLHYNHT